MLDIGETLLISKPQIWFAVPFKAIHYSDYLEHRAKAKFDLPPRKPFLKWKRNWSESKLPRSLADEDTSKKS